MKCSGGGDCPFWLPSLLYLLTMTRAEIDTEMQLLHKLRTEDPVRGLELSQRLISDCLATGYTDHLLQARLYHADLLVRTGSTEQGEQEYLNCVEEAKKQQNQTILGRATTALGLIKAYNDDLVGAKQLLEEGLSIALTIGDKEGEGSALGHLAQLYSQWGLRDLATEYAKQSYEVLKGESSITLPLFRLASLSTIAGDHESAIRFFKEGLAVLHANNINTSRSPFYTDIANVYSRLGRFEEAREYYERSLATTEATGNIDSRMNSLVLLGANDVNLKDFNSAEKRLTTALEWGLRYQSKRVIWCYYYLATLAFYRGNHAQAIEILDRDVLPLKPNFELTDGCYGLYIEAYTLLEDWKNVAAYEKKLREFRIELNTSQFKSKLAGVQSLIAADREKHEKDIEKMKREQLERELSTMTLQLLAQTEQLAEFREGILAVIRKTPPTEGIAKELREKLKVLPCKSIDWDKFEAQFKAAHPEFQLRLKESYPDLSKMETRICTLIRMNLKSPDISRLTCLSERNIENHRYRIRKKMKLVKEQDLGQELMKL